MTPGRLLWLIRRDCKRGLSAAWHDYHTLPRILRRPPGNLPPAPWPIEVHVLLGKNTWLLTLWMLASWEHHTGHRWRVRLWEDGTLEPDMLAALARARPEDTIVSKREAGPSVEAVLSAYPACATYRNRHPLAQKIFDIPLLATTEHLLLLDSDVLFFKRPSEILSWCESPDKNCWFNEDVTEGSLITQAEAAKLGVDLWPKVNSGLCLISRDFLDLDLCERALTETSLLDGHPWRVEQTLVALCASHHGKGGLLPQSYEVSLERQRHDNAVARHYVGAVRDRFYAEGVAELAPILLP